MRSDIYDETDTMGYILNEVERVGIFCGLSSADAGKLRLLAEETLCLTIRMFNDLEFEFFIENEGRKFTLNLSAKTFVDLEQKEKMLSLSSRGENIAAKGILGKISSVFQDMLMVAYDPNIRISPYTEGLRNPGIMLHSYSDEFYFSMYSYIQTLPERDKREQWDGLEKSIIANLANDVRIGIKSGKVEVISAIEF